MTELTQAEIKRRTGLLAQARQLVNKEYIAQRTEQHQHWIANSESSWRTNGALLPYPSGIIYPSEDEIVAKALELYNASASQPNLNPLPLPEVPPMSAAIFNPDITATVTAQLQEASVSVESSPIDIPVSSPWIDHLQEPEVVPEPDVVVEPEMSVSDEIQSTVAKNSLLRNVLSGWLQKNKDKET
jgi:hypothetical protein